MPYYIKQNSSGSWHTKDGNLTTNTVGGVSVRHGYSSESEANSAISSLGLSGVTVMEV
jgi:hypothetical protein